MAALLSPVLALRRSTLACLSAARGCAQRTCQQVRASCKCLCVLKAETEVWKRVMKAAVEAQGRVYWPLLGDGEPSHA